MVKIAATLAALLPMAAAWPAVMEELAKREKGDGRLNTGAGHPFPTFDSDAQFVDVRPGTEHEFRSPGPNDLRGECPGLNAAANHGFLPRNGKATILDTVNGLGEAYNMAPGLAAGLAAIAILISGDIPTTTWSIGGEFPATNLAGIPLLANPKGIVGSHNKYEGDASIIRGDAYLNDGNVGVFQWRSWNNLMSLVEANNDRMTMYTAVTQSNFVTQYSMANNPHYFSGPFSGLVAPAAHNFVVNFMSNHTADQPGGYLDKEILKSFFAVTGDNPSNYKQHRGQERIPENWWRRPGGLNQYQIADVFLDLLAGAASYPDTLHIGGNTGKVNTFTGVNIADLTGGVFNGATLLEGNNLACFAFQAAMAGGIDELGTLEKTLGTLLSPVLGPIEDAVSSFSDCPQLTTANFDPGHFRIFPGYNDSN